MIAADKFISAEELSAMHDGELEGPRREIANRHVAECRSCSQLLQVWQGAERELVRPAADRRTRMLLGPAVLLLGVLLTAGIAAAAGLGPFRVLRVVATPDPISRGAAVLARGESLEQMRALTGLPLPSSAQLTGSWQLLGVIKNSSGGALLTYGRAAEQLSVNVLPLASKPVVVVDPANAEEVAVAGTPAVLVRRLPSNSFEAVFENRNSVVVMTTDGGRVSREELLGLITKWLSTAQ